MNIHFVCRGNVLRSQIAEAYLKSLALKGVHVTSSGTVADQYREANKVFITSAKELLDRHGIKQFSKVTPEQLTQDKWIGQDLVVFMNQIIQDEARSIVVLPQKTINWNVTDIGEGDRAIDGNRVEYEEIIYKEIVDLVDDLVTAKNLSRLGQS